jgi:hypothetical protein
MMTPRSIRRAAERKAAKLARKVAQTQSPESFTPAVDTNIESPAQESPAPAIPPAAANAGLSAVTSALTGYATLLPVTDAAPYNQLLLAYQAEFQPVGLQESNLVQSLAEITWRTRRILALEMSIFAKGRIEFAKQFAEHKPELREALIDVHTFLTYEKQIRGLQLQEARLVRRTDKQTAELRQLQKDRKEREKQSQSSAPKANGFVFSNPPMPPQLTAKQPNPDQYAPPQDPQIHAEAA